jgi:hypothetical protein
LLPFLNSFRVTGSFSGKESKSKKGGSYDKMSYSNSRSIDSAMMKSSKPSYDDYDYDDKMEMKSDSKMKKKSSKGFEVI